MRWPWGVSLFVPGRIQGFAVAVDRPAVISLLLVREAQAEPGRPTRRLIGHVQHFAKARDGLILSTLERVGTAHADPGTPRQVAVGGLGCS